MSAPAGLKAAIFDFDGTLIDSAPDLVAALNVLRARRRLPPVEASLITALAASGSRAMMREFLLEDGEDIEEHRRQFLAAYDATGHKRTRLFDGVGLMLDALERGGVSWSIVTNKPKMQTQQALQALDLQGKAAQLVCGDTLRRAKPHPDGLLKVCAELGLQPQSCLYVGDNVIDIQAAAACEMPFAAAGWGYWHYRNAEVNVLDSPAEILPLVGLGC